MYHSSSWSRILEFERRLEHGFILTLYGWVSCGLFVRVVGEGHGGWCSLIMRVGLCGYFGLGQDSIRVGISCPLRWLGGIWQFLIRSLKACPHRFESVSVTCLSRIIWLHLSWRRSLFAPAPVFRWFGWLSCPILNRRQSAIDSRLTVAKLHLRLRLLLLIRVIFNRRSRYLYRSFRRAWSLKGSPVRTRIPSIDHGQLFILPFRLIVMTSFQGSVWPSLCRRGWQDYVDTRGEKDYIILVLSGRYKCLIDLLHLLVILLEFEAVCPIVLMSVVQQSLV